MRRLRGSGRVEETVTTLDADTLAGLLRSLRPEDADAFAEWCQTLGEEDLAIVGRAVSAVAEGEWAGWLRYMFPRYFRAPFADHHRDLWEWVWRLELGVRPAETFVAVWPRGGGKSVSAEAAVAACGARGTRRFVLYVSASQQQADDHVQTLAGMLESRHVAENYPELGERAIGKYGNVRGWRRNRLRTTSGLVVDALGLDTAARGIKVDEFRPDLIVFDDIDDETDGPGQVEKKIRDVTQKLLPTGDSSLAVLVIQNVPNPDGIVARLAGISDQAAPYLRPRQVSGPIPALTDFTYEEAEDGTFTILSGEPTWEGQGLERCQEQVNEWGITAFRAEALHETDARGGGMFDHLTYRHCTPEQVAWDQITQVAVWCDPAVTTTDRSDHMAVQCDALAGTTLYRLRSWEERATPVTAIKVAIAYAIRYGTRKVGIETDQGGDTWNSVYKEAEAEVRADLGRLDAGETVEGPDEYVRALAEIAEADLAFPMLYSPAQEKAGVTQQSKAGRAQQMLAQYESTTRQVVHVIGTHGTLERALNRFPARKPYDLVDAAYWSARDLLKFGQGTSTSARRMAQARLPAVSRPTVIIPGQSRIR